MPVFSQVARDSSSKFFIILTGGRSGSNLIRDALCSHPDVICFGEIFEDPQSDELTDKGLILPQRRRHESATAFARRAFSFGSHGKAIGFKLKYYHFAGTRLAALIRNHRIAVIHNKRRNIIAQSLSLPMAEMHEFGRWQWDKAQIGLYRRAVKVDIEDFIYRCEDNLRSARVFDRYFSCHVPMLDVFYDDFCHTNSVGVLTQKAAVESLLSFLEVSPATLKSAFQKQRLIPYQSLIKNFHDLRIRALHKHPEWQPYFDEIDSESLVV